MNMHVKNPYKMYKMNKKNKIENKRSENNMKIKTENPVKSQWK